MSFVNLDPISTQVEFGDDFAKLARVDKAEVESAAEAAAAEAAADKSPESTSARLQRLRAEALEGLRKGRHEAFGGIECVAAAAGQTDEAAAGARVEAAPAALLSDAERTRRLALAPPALLLMQEGAIEGERPPYEGLYRLDEGSFVNQRPLFRLTEIPMETPGHSVPRFLAFVNEGKVQTWAGQLDTHLGSTTAYLQLVDSTVPATPDRHAPSWQGAVWQDALSPEGQWTVRPKLRCTALTEEQTGAWAGIEVEGQLMATGIAISVVGFVDEEEFTEYVLHSILQADDGTMTEHRAKHRFSNFVQLHAAVQPSLAPYVPSKFPLGRMQVALTPAGKAAAKQKRGQQLQGYLRQLAAAAALKGVRRGGPRLYILDCLPHQVDHILDCLPHQVCAVAVPGSTPSSTSTRGCIWTRTLCRRLAEVALVQALCSLPSFSERRRRHAARRHSSRLRHSATSRPIRRRRRRRRTWTYSRRSSSSRAGAACGEEARDRARRVGPPPSTLMTTDAPRGSRLTKRKGSRAPWRAARLCSISMRSLRQRRCPGRRLPSLGMATVAPMSTRRRPRPVTRSPPPGSSPPAGAGSLERRRWRRPS